MKISQYLPSLQGEIVGEYDDSHGLGYFRGIPYATVSKRWTHSVLQHSLNSPFDATAFGPRCTQEEGEVLVSGGTSDPTPGDDEFNCLNLNICVPRESIQQLENGHTRKKIPVMVWIHGGAFKYGANSVARYRPHRLCASARISGHPIVLVQVGYRLGALGFAASEDLAAEMKEESDVNGAGCKGNTPTADLFVGNFGFVDQRNALKWVQEHIQDFGGDPDNVTAFGISAGSASVHHHILTGDPMFDRAICMSGAAPTLGPLPFHRYQQAWEDLCSKMNVSGEPAKARLERLRSIPPREILRSYSDAAMGPMADGVLLPKAWTFEQTNQTRCRSLIIGDTNVEAIILDGLARRMKPSQFQKNAQDLLSEAETSQFFRLFGFTGDDQQPWDAYRDSMRRFMSVMMFQFPNLRIAETFQASGSGNAFLYHFEELSPFPGPTYGVSYHGQCALYMYGVENDTLPLESRRVAEAMAETWTAFAHEKEPWEPYSVAERFMRFGPSGTIELRDASSDETREYGHLAWLKEHFEPVMRLAQNVLQAE